MELFAVEVDHDDVRFERHEVGDAADLIQPAPKYDVVHATEHGRTGRSSARLPLPRRHNAVFFYQNHVRFKDSLPSRGHDDDHLLARCEVG
jgi:hypothetical protein